MAFRRAPNEPRARARRAWRRLRAQERTEDERFGSVPGRTRGSEVLARSRPGQSRIERRSPARVITLSFLALCAVGTALLMLPGMAEGGRATLSVAMFTAVSAGCVTGLTTVDVYEYWSPLGEAAIAVLISVGGFGIQALGTLWILLLNRRLGTSSRLAAQAETGALTQGDVRLVLRALVIITVTVETLVATMLTLRLWLTYDMPLGSAAWDGAFHAIMAYNNSGFVSLVKFAGDPLILGPISFGIVMGGLGFLVILELWTRATKARGLLFRAPSRMSAEGLRQRSANLARRSRYRLGNVHTERMGFANPIPMSLHTRLMLLGTAGLWVIGASAFALFEWRNPATLGSLPHWERAVNSFFSGAITPRTGGFSAVNYEDARTETRFLTDVLMFVGGGSGSTAGGIKVTTLMVLVMAVIAEVRGHRDVNTFDRRIPDQTVRVSVAVIMISGSAVVVGTMAMIWMTDLSLDLAMFEVISALATVGLSANVTATLPQVAQLLLIVLMILGRVGPITLASSLTMNTGQRHYRLPEGRPMVG